MSIEVEAASDDANFHRGGTAWIVFDVSFFEI
jgi:hypothetical protein